MAGDGAKQSAEDLVAELALTSALYKKRQDTKSRLTDPELELLNFGINPIAPACTPASYRVHEIYGKAAAGHYHGDEKMSRGTLSDAYRNIQPSWTPKPTDDARSFYREREDDLREGLQTAVTGQQPGMLTNLSLAASVQCLFVDLQDTVATSPMVWELDEENKFRPYSDSPRDFLNLMWRRRLYAGIAVDGADYALNKPGHFFAFIWDRQDGVLYIYDSARHDDMGRSTRFTACFASVLEGANLGYDFTIVKAPTTPQESVWECGYLSWRFLQQSLRGLVGLCRDSGVDGAGHEHAEEGLQRPRPSHAFSIRMQDWNHAPDPSQGTALTDDQRYKVSLFFVIKDYVDFVSGALNILDNRVFLTKQPIHRFWNNSDQMAMPDSQGQHHLFTRLGGFDPNAQPMWRTVPFMGHRVLKPTDAIEHRGEEVWRQ